MSIMGRAILEMDLASVMASERWIVWGFWDCVCWFGVGVLGIIGVNMSACSLQGRRYGLFGLQLQLRGEEVCWHIFVSLCINKHKK